MVQLSHDVVEWFVTIFRDCAWLIGATLTTQSAEPAPRLRRSDRYIALKFIVAVAGPATVAFLTASFTYAWNAHEHQTKMEAAIISNAKAIEELALLMKKNIEGDEKWRESFESSMQTHLRDHGLGRFSAGKIRGH